MSQAKFGPYIECSLSLAVDLVNTFDPVDGSEGLPDLDALRKFVADQQMSGSPRPTQADLEHVRELRGLLRRVFDAATPDEAVAILNRLLAESQARPELTDHDGPWHLHFTPMATPLAPRIAAETAMALSVVIAEDGFDRLSSCQSETCDDVFVDESRNRSRRYCSPDVCGNRASVAAYRARKRAERDA